MKKVQGNPLPLGVTIQENKVNFSVAVPDGQACSLLLYRKGEMEPCNIFEMEKSLGEVRTLALENIEPHLYEYNYLIDENVVVDPYAKALSGNETWGVEKAVAKHEIRAKIALDRFDWECDEPLQIPYHEVIAYSFHVRGFTKDSKSGVKDKGTFEGVIEKIPYLKELGINQIQCLPVYEFNETGEKCNYWGYGEGFYFNQKNAYSAVGNGPVSLKKMVKACHEAGIEVVLEMPFYHESSRQMMGECLRYYMMEYHVDGFVLNPYVASMEVVCSDPILKHTKIMKHQTDFQNDMRHFLKGDEGMVPGVMFWLRHTSRAEGIFNYIASHSGFTAYDMVSYAEKHNEENGENNRDGSDYNLSWNCGEEGESECEEVIELRKKQLRNAFFLVLLSQGTPCILAGDEFANSQKGNNNVYCQDNETGWVNWEKLEEEQELFEFVKALINLRKKLPVFYPESEMTGKDMAGIGVPDVSYHGEGAWRAQTDRTSRQLGVYYSGVMMEQKSDGKTGQMTRGKTREMNQKIAQKACYVAYNMHWLKHEFAIPNLPGQKKWYMVASTKDGVLKQPVLLKKQQKICLEPRTIVVMTEE